MKITTRHEASQFGRPVVLDDEGRVMKYDDGIRAVLARLGWTRPVVAERCGVSVRTVEGWLQGRMPEVAALNVLSDALTAL